MSSDYMMYEHLKNVKRGMDRKTHMLIYTYLKRNTRSFTVAEIAKQCKRSQTQTLLVLEKLEEAGIVESLTHIGRTTATPPSTVWRLKR